MSGWGVLTWLAAIAVGPMTFLALVAHRVADCAIGLERLEADQRKSRQRRMEADPDEIVLASKSGHRAPAAPADKEEGHRHEKVDQSPG